MEQPVVPIVVIKDEHSPVRRLGKWHRTTSIKTCTANNNNKLLLRSTAGVGTSG